MSDQPMVLVEWFDIAYLPEWYETDGPPFDSQPSPIRTIGWLVKETPSFIYIAMMRDLGRVANVYAIPRGCIAKITPLIPNERTDEGVAGPVFCGVEQPGQSVVSDPLSLLICHFLPGHTGSHSWQCTELNPINGTDLLCIKKAGHPGGHTFTHGVNRG